METNNIKKAIPKVFEGLLTNLGFDNDSIPKKSSMHCATTIKGRLDHNPELKAGVYKDALYFINAANTENRKQETISCKIGDIFDI